MIRDPQSGRERERGFFLLVKRYGLWSSHVLSAEGFFQTVPEV